MGRIYIVGMGPGEECQMTLLARNVLEQADVIVGYTKYVDLLGEAFKEKEKLTTGMKQEVERCRLCFEEAHKDKTVALVCSGDAGVYGMASLIYELLPEYDGVDGGKSVEIEVVAGITAALSGAAVLGAPINHDFCTISLSDLLTPWEVIEKRLRGAALGDFVIAIYNPSSHKRKDYLERACSILMELLPESQACGYVRNIGRDDTKIWTGTLAELANEQVDMFTTCFIGNSSTYIQNGKLITPRGYLTRL